MLDPMERAYTGEYGLVLLTPNPLALYKVPKTWTLRSLVSSGVRVSPSGPSFVWAMMNSSRVLL